MRWLALTVALLSASAALIAGIYFRDRDTSWQPPERARAEFDARWLLWFVAGPTCGDRCAVKLISHPQNNHWLVWLDDRSRTQCVDIDVTSFNITEGHGVSGMSRRNCTSYAKGLGD